MKVFKLVLLASILFFSTITKAQVSINVNIGAPPAWGPVGYPDARYYYLPDIQSYYDVSTAMFIYRGPRGWIHARYLPEIYAGFDLYNGCKVVLDFRGDNPYRYYPSHCVRYPRGYKVYYDKPHKHDNGNHYGEYKHGKPKHREVIYVNDNYNGRRYDGYDGRRGGGDDDDHGGDRGHGHGHGRRG